MPSVKILNANNEWEYVSSNASGGQDNIHVSPEAPIDESINVWIDTSSDPSEEGRRLPEVTEADNGKIMMVVDGKWVMTTINTPEFKIDENGVLSL
jgi:hypothetical protein